MNSQLLLMFALAVTWWSCGEAKLCRDEGGTCVFNGRVSKTECQALDAQCPARFTCCTKEIIENKIRGKQKRKCKKTTKKCKKAGGTCVKSEECTGTAEDSLCKGASCTCCITDKDCACGVRNTGKIVGGSAVQPNEYPWHVGLVFDFDTYDCGGSIIRNNYILTAAHCVTNFNGKPIKPKAVTVGVADHDQTSSSDDISGVTQKVAVKKIIVHEDYDPDTLDSDIALLQLKTPLDLSSSSALGAVCLPADSSETYEGFTGTITGWGTDEFGVFNPPDELFSVDLPILSNADCATQDTAGVDVTSNMLCAAVEGGGKDSCSGDSGGPLVVENNGKYEQVGVVSFGNGCAGANQPGVYARVSEFVGWINKKTKQTTAC